MWINMWINIFATNLINMFPKKNQQNVYWINQQKTSKSISIEKHGSILITINIRCSGSTSGSRRRTYYVKDIFFWVPRNFSQEQLHIDIAKQNNKKNTFLGCCFGSPIEHPNRKTAAMPFRERKRVFSYFS